jgi:hypothetical protein
MSKTPKPSQFADVLAKDVITEQQINLIKKRMNASDGKPDADTQEAIDHIWEGEVELTPDQNAKGLKYLMNLWKSPTGKERVNNPFGYREEEALETFHHFELRGFYNASMNRNFSFWIPIYIVVGKSTTFEYYISGGEISIIGENGGEFFREGGKVTYIPNADIESLKTNYGKTFKADKLLDGAYVKGKVNKPQVTRTQFEDESFEYADGGTVPKLRRLKKGDIIEIYGKRWFQKSYGNTYHSVKIFVNDELIGQNNFEYGYGDGYVDTAMKMLWLKFARPKGMSESSPMYTLRDLGIKVIKNVQDVDAKKNLEFGGEAFGWGGRVKTKQQRSNDRSHSSEEKWEIAYRSKRRTPAMGYKGVKKD